MQQKREGRGPANPVPPPCAGMSVRSRGEGLPGREASVRCSLPHRVPVCVCACVRVCACACEFTVCACVRARVSALCVHARVQLPGCTA